MGRKKSTDRPDDDFVTENGCENPRRKLNASSRHGLISFNACHLWPDDKAGNARRLAGIQIVLNTILRNLIAAVILSFLMLIAGLVIWYFKKDCGISLQDILFYVGAAPIVIFSLGQLGSIFGRGDHTYQLSRSVSNQSANQRAVQDLRDIKFWVKSGFSWIIAGLLVWLYSAFI